MSEITLSRFCPICEQIVPRDQNGISIKIAPNRFVLLHEGCVQKILVAALEYQSITDWFPGSSSK